MNRYLVSYDISDPKRLRRIYKTMKGFGKRLQFSVFSCDLSAKQRVMLIVAITGVINDREDHVLVADLGPVDGRAGECFEFLGIAQELPVRKAIIV